MVDTKEEKKSLLGGDKEQISALYFVDSDGNYQKCHKLLPDIRRIFGEIEYIEGEPVEIIPNRERKTMETTTIRQRNLRRSRYRRSRMEDSLIRQWWFHQTPI